VRLAPRPLVVAVLLQHAEEQADEGGGGRGNGQHRHEQRAEGAAIGGRGSRSRQVGKEAAHRAARGELDRARGHRRGKQRGRQQRQERPPRVAGQPGGGQHRAREQNQQGDQEEQAVAPRVGGEAAGQSTDLAAGVRAVPERRAGEPAHGRPEIDAQDEERGGKAGADREQAGQLGGTRQGRAARRQLRGKQHEEAAADADHERAQPHGRGDAVRLDAHRAALSHSRLPPADRRPAAAR
jgi:hypothetical protein